MAFYTDITVARKEPEPITLAKQLTAALATEVPFAHMVGTDAYRLKKDTDWTPADIALATSTITNAPALTEQLQAQVTIDALPVLLKAIVLTLIDEVNILRQAAGMQPRTVQQAINAIKNKAGTL